MLICRACGHENPEGSKFCNGCGSGLETEPRAAAEERKVVSVLFCDLVGSTSLAEGKDPEDVRATLRPYHELLRRDIESYGGTVEKFVGDAIMAVFGAPTSHEDDPERAIRAGLRILVSIDELNEDRGTDLSVRVGINTGEALAVLSARPEHGEGMVAGDVVNTAARLQTGAPIGGIAVGETTYLFTKEVFDYEPLQAIAAKGKSKPVRAWRAVAARARFGTDITRRHDVALVGRDAERELLRHLLERAIRERSFQLVTILGEPGVGKSRLIYELLALVAERDEPVVWRQGRCLPYGEGIAFWALGEIVKSEAGILESDSPVQAEAKLDRALQGLPLETDELGWIRARLAPLVGFESPSSATRDESFTAWRRFLETLARSGGAVLVFEDLHWADPALLEFLEHVSNQVEGVPMLLVCTARPELSKRHPNFTGNLRDATVLNLAPLTGKETATLVGALLGTTLLPADVQNPIVERAGGNPLYAEEFVRMLRDRGLLDPRGQSWELSGDAEFPFPEGIHGIISARLDTLKPDRKSLLQDASVIGKDFWSGALEAMGDRDEGEVREALHELTKAQFLHEIRTSSMEGEREYTFWHMLVRDAAYAQIPRAARADKHVAVATWLEGRAGGRVEDLADVLAYHSFEALELARASGRDLNGLEQQAVRFLVLAGDRAKGLDPARALVMYERALSLVPEGDPIRAEILHDLGFVEFARGRYGRSRDLLQEAIPALRAADKPARAADAGVLLPLVLNTIAPSAAHRRLLDQAIVELEGLPPGKELVSAYAMRAGWDSASSMNIEAIGWANKSLSLAEELGLPESPWARITRGRARWWSGDVGGPDDIRRGIDLALEQGSVLLAAYGYEDLSIARWESEGPSAGLPELEAGAALALKSGVLDAAESIDVNRSEILHALGRWDEAMDTATNYLAGDREDRNSGIQFTCQLLVCNVATWRGDLDRASELSHDVHLGVRAFGDAQPSATVCLSVVASAALAAGDVDRAVSVLHELEAFPNIRQTLFYPESLPQITRVALGAVGVEFAHQLAMGVPQSPKALHRISTEMVEAQLAEARGELERAVELYASAEEGWRIFSVPERAQSLLGRGRCLLAMGDPEAAAALREANEVFTSLKAELYIPEVNSLLEQAVARSS